MLLSIECNGVGSADNVSFEHLTAQRVAMIDKVISEEFQKALAKIERKEEIKQKHRTIQARLKKPRTQLTYVVQTYGTTAVGQEMADAIQQFNSIHFQQACSNGASAASASRYASGLRPFRTPEQAANRNIEEILSGTFDKNQIQSHMRYHITMNCAVPINQSTRSVHPSHLQIMISTGQI